MSPTTGPAEALQSWLGSAAGLSAMSVAARQLVRRLRHLGLRTALDRFGIGPNTPFVNAVDEVRGELYRFVLENADRLSRALAVDVPDTGLYLCQAFVNHCRDLERQRGGNGFRFHYRRAAEALRRDGRFVTDATADHGLRYSLCPQSRTIGPLSDEDLAAIAPPTDVSMAAAPDYPDCARMFWQALSARFGGRSIWVPVRDVIRWLQHHGLLATRPVQVTLTDEMAVSIAAPAQTAFDPDQVHRWAVMFAAGLAPSDRRLWFLRFGRNLGFKDIAQAMGTYRGASGPHARIAKLQEALCDFIQSHGLPWLGPEEIDKEAWTVFFDTLLAEVEKDAAVPSSEGKAPSIAPARRPKDQS